MSGEGSGEVSGPGGRGAAPGAGAGVKAAAMPGLFCRTAATSWASAGSGPSRSVFPLAGRTLRVLVRTVHSFPKG